MKMILRSIMSLTLLMLMMAFGAGGQGVVLSPASAGGGTEGQVDARAVYEDSGKVKAVEEKDSGRTRPLSIARTNEEEMKRLKMIFMVIMNLGPQRGPAR